MTYCLTVTVRNPFLRRCPGHELCKSTREESVHYRPSWWLRLSIADGGQKMPSLKADWLTLVSILVYPQVKRHTSSFDRAFYAQTCHWHTHMCPRGASAWREKVNKVKVCLKGFDYVISTVHPIHKWKLYVFTQSYFSNVISFCNIKNLLPPP